MNEEASANVKPTGFYRQVRGGAWSVVMDEISHGLTFFDNRKKCIALSS